MSKEAKIMSALFGLMLLILALETVDLFRTYHGRHLAFRIILNVVLLALFGASLVRREKPN